MISSIEWIPAGVADPNPKKYELSSTEQELLQMIDENGNFVPSDDTAGNGTTRVVDDIDDEGKPQSKRSSGSTPNKTTKRTQLPLIENNLPPDLRMEEYSDDDDEDDEEKDRTGTAAIGRLLVGDDDDDHDDDDERMEEEYVNDVDEENVLHDIQHRKNKNDDDDNDNDDDDDDDDNDDDDLDDVPDTREYEPIDVAGLEAMGLGHHYGTNDGFDHDNNDDDDESEQEDVALTPDDALVVVAKTEDVRFLGWKMSACVCVCVCMLVFFLSCV
jgi:hypothetical protein